MCFCISFTQKMCEIAKVAKVSASFFSIISKWKWSLVSTISDRIRYLILDFRGFSSWWNKQTGEKIVFLKFVIGSVISSLLLFFWGAKVLSLENYKHMPQKMWWKNPKTHILGLLPNPSQVPMVHRKKTMLFSY